MSDYIFEQVTPILPDNIDALELADAILFGPLSINDRFDIALSVNYERQPLQVVHRCKQRAKDTTND